MHADDDLVYVVRTNHVLGARSGNTWLDGDIHIDAGDTIVSPRDTERMPPLTFWLTVTSIIYKLPISAPAVQFF